MPERDLQTESFEKFSTKKRSQTLRYGECDERSDRTNQTILVVGGGISGMSAALEAAECGKQVILIEKTPSVGGRVSQLYRYFPKLCHPPVGSKSI